MPELAVGSTFAEHIIRGVAGRGGMGVVYRAMHLALKREVALKVIGPEYSEQFEFRERLQRECETAASIQHPSVVPIYHAGEEDGRLYVTMRYVEGSDLHRLVPRGRLEPGYAATLIAQVAEGLDAAHRRGIVHRDVKPANVLIATDGSALLTDFGLTKHASDRTLTKDGTFVGTLDYAAPEQFRGDPVDARTDVYALGGVLYHALTGRVPYPRESDAAKMYAHLEMPPPSVTVLVEEVPEALAHVVQRAMATDPADRFQSGGEMAAALQGTLGRPGELTVVSPAEPVLPTTIPL